MEALNELQMLSVDEAADWGPRLLAATAMGAVIGWDREMRKRPAGLRTHALVSMAAAAFTMLAFEILARVYLLDAVSEPDPMRAIGAIMTGVAFLGAGSIISRGKTVEGLTTSASVWLAGAVGVSVGMGTYLFAGALTLIACLVLVFLKPMEDKAQEAGKKKED